MEDIWARDSLVELLAEKVADIDVLDYPVRDSFDPSWRAECQMLIAKCSATVVLIGPITWVSDAVAWEIAESARQGHPTIGIQTSDLGAYQVPAGLDGADILPWNPDRIVQRLTNRTRNVSR